MKVHHVKPHGALYNQAARTPNVASAITKAVDDFDPDLIVYGLSGSHLIKEAKALNLRTANEVFADRTYQDDGSLSARTNPQALITNETLALNQVLKMIKEQLVVSVNNVAVPIIADTICIHGDGLNAVNFAEVINQQLKNNNIEIRTI